MATNVGLFVTTMISPAGNHRVFKKRKEKVREQKYHQLMKKMMIGLAAAAFAATACGAGVETWRATELAFEAGADYDATGADAVTFDAVFTHESGEKVSRPGFWDGGKTFRVRFAPTKPGRWSWITTCQGDGALGGKSGTLEAKPYAGDLEIYRRGFVKVAKGDDVLEPPKEGQPTPIPPQLWRPWRASAWELPDGTCLGLVGPQRIGVNVSFWKDKSFHPDAYALFSRAEIEPGKSFDVPDHPFVAGAYCRSGIESWREVCDSIRENR